MEMKNIEVSEETYDRIMKDKKHFEDTIGGGDWSIDNTLIEYFKMLDNLVDEEFKK